MEIFDLLRARHSVRSYTERRIEGNVLASLESAVAAANEESRAHGGACPTFRLCVDEPEAFNANKAHYGMIRGCRNYFACYLPEAKRDADATAEADELIGYYGERLVLTAQELGLNTCWVGLTYRKGKAATESETGARPRIVIALGYGKTQGVVRRKKAATTLSNVAPDSPEWFKRGMEAVCLAPSAVNQQRYYFELRPDGTVAARAKFTLFGYAAMDLGIAKFHFELGAGKGNFRWA